MHYLLNVNGEMLILNSVIESSDIFLSPFVDRDLLELSGFFGNLLIPVDASLTFVFASFVICIKKCTIMTRATIIYLYPK